MESIQTMSCDMITLQLSQHLSRILCRVGVTSSNFVSCRSDIMLQHLFIQELLQYMHFQFDYLCSVTTYDIIFAAVARYIIKHLFNETARSILY